MENTTSMTTLEAITADSETTPKTGGRFDSSLNSKPAYRSSKKSKYFMINLIHLFQIPVCMESKTSFLSNFTMLT